MVVRAGEQERTWYRSERVFWSGNGWFFMTREQTQEGPFDSRGEAERELNYYIRRVVEWGTLQKERA